MIDTARTTTASTSKDEGNIKQQKITRIKSKIEYHIYHSGEIKYKLIDETGNGTEKTENSLKNFRSKARYIYHDISNNEHEIGTYDITVTENTYTDYQDKLGGNKIYLININDNISNYSDGEVEFTLTINTTRPYVSDVATASLLGAMLNTGYMDFNFNGGSDARDVSPAPSSSHKNGTNLDLRYLRNDTSGNGVHLDLNDETGDPCGWKGLDVERQNKFIEALNLFGWDEILGWEYWSSVRSPTTGHIWDEWYATWRADHPGETGKPILTNITHYRGHNHHIHLQKYNPTLEYITS